MEESVTPAPTPSWPRRFTTASFPRAKSVAIRLPSARTLVACWVLAMISLPISVWVLGDTALAIGSSVGVILQTLAVAAVVRESSGWTTLVTLFCGVAICSLAAEVIGSETGYPFGDYAYTDRLQPQVLGVPLTIPCAWFMMLIPSWAIAARITGRRQGLAFTLVAALAFTTWDLFLDPQMVQWGFWEWSIPGGYFGIPWTNYLGWFVTAALVTTIVPHRPVDDPLLVAVFGLTWALESIGTVVFWNLALPGLIGCVAMGLVLWLAIRNPRARQLAS